MLAPVPSGLADVVQIAVGDSHACALTNNGSVVCWGALSWGWQAGSRAISGGKCDSRITMLRSCRAGENHYGETNVPSGLVDVVQIALGDGLIGSGGDGAILGEGAGAISVISHHNVNDVGQPSQDVGLGEPIWIETCATRPRDGPMMASHRPRTAPCLPQQTTVPLLVRAQV